MEGSSDKGDHPLFLSLSGPGTGKSRLLDEFHRLACETCEKEDLLSKLKGAYIFKVGLENGTRNSDGSWIPEVELGCRMYHQLHPDSVNWTDFKMDTKSQVSPFRVLQILAEVEKKNIKDITVMILVDGLQNLFHVHGSKTSAFYGVLTELAALSNFSALENHAFVVCCAGGTCGISVDEWLGPSTQRRAILTPPKLDGSKIINVADERIKLLVEDMGGNGRALEILSEVVDRELSVRRTEDLVVTALRDRYPRYEAYQGKEFPYEIAAAILTGQTFRKEERLGHDTIENIVNYGLITLNAETNRLECPFVWLKLVVPSLLEEVYADTLCVDNYLDPEGSPLGRGEWAQFEDFTAFFFVMKTKLLNGRIIDWYKLHAGAKFKEMAGPKVEVRELKIAYLKCPPKECFSDSKRMPNEYETRLGKVDPRKCNTMFRSVATSPAGDSFCCVKMESGEVVSFAMSNKLRIKARSLAMYMDEFHKAACSQDFFIEYCKSHTKTFSSNDLPNDRCGLVADENFQDYFGPFAGRAFRFKKPIFL